MGSHETCLAEVYPFSFRDSTILHFRVFANRETAMFRKHLGPSFPDLIELAKRTPLIMANTNELYDFPRPTLSKIVNIGGLGMKKVDAKPLEGVRYSVNLGNEIVK